MGSWLGPPVVRGTIRETGRTDWLGNPVADVTINPDFGQTASDAASLTGATLAAALVGFGAVMAGWVGVLNATSARGTRSWARVPLSERALAQARAVKRPVGEKAASYLLWAGVSVLVGAVVWLIAAAVVHLSNELAYTIAFFAGMFLGLPLMTIFVTPVLAHRLEGPAWRAVREANMADYERAMALRGSVQQMVKAANADPVGPRSVTVSGASLVYLRAGSDYALLSLPSGAHEGDVFRARLPLKSAASALINESLVSLGAAYGGGTHIAQALKDIASGLAASFQSQASRAGDRLTAIAALSPDQRPLIEVRGIPVGYHIVVAGTIRFGTDTESLRVFPVGLVTAIADLLGLQFGTMFEAQQQREAGESERRAGLELISLPPSPAPTVASRLSELERLRLAGLVTDSDAASHRTRIL